MRKRRRDWAGSKCIPLANMPRKFSTAAATWGVRTRSLARPRQVAMALAKELTEHSLPEIGMAFDGRDHTTVLHACRQIRQLMESDGKLHEDWDKLIRKLSE